MKILARTLEWPWPLVYLYSGRKGVFTRTVLMYNYYENIDCLIEVQLFNNNYINFAAMGLLGDDVVK